VAAGGAQGQVFLDRGQLRAQAHDLVQVAVADQQHLSPGGVDHVLQFQGLGAIVDWQKGEPGFGGGVVAGHVQVGIGIQRGDYVVRLQSNLLEYGTDPADQVSEPGIGMTPLIEDQDFLLGQDCRRNGKETNRVHGLSSISNSLSAASESGKGRPFPGA
jgi:hypothetical protein